MYIKYPNQIIGDGIALFDFEKEDVFKYKHSYFVDCTDYFKVVSN